MASAEQRTAPPLLERGAELARLTALAGAAAAGDGHVVLIEGESGAGRSALLAALREQLAGSHRVLTARGSALEHEHAFGLVRQLLEPVASGSPEVLAGPAAPAGDILQGTTPEDDARSPFAALHALYWLTSNLAEDAPLVLCIDDAHHGDRDSLRFVDYLTMRLEGLRALVVLSRAREAAPAPDLDRLAARAETERLLLRGLSAPASMQLVRHWLGKEAPDALCSACHEATGGIPLLLRELVRELARGEGAASDPETARSLVPPAIVSIVRHRLDQLSPQAGRLARALAVLGMHARPADAAGLAELDETAAARAGDELAAAGLMDGDEVVRPLVALALGDAIGRRERAALHRRAARLLARDPDRCEEAAAHLLATPPGGRDWVAAILREAAARARARGAPETAATLLRRAHAEPPPAAEQAVVALELAEAAYRAGIPDVVELAEGALPLQTEPDLRLRAGIALGHSYTLAGRVADAASGVTAALAGGGASQALVREAEALVLAWSAASTEARAATAGRSAAATQAAEVLGDRAPAVLLSLAALERATAEGDAGRALELARRGWARRHEVPSAAPFETYFIFAAITSGALAEAEEWTTAMAERGARSAHVVMMIAAAARGWVRLLRGDLAGAEADAWGAAEMLEHAGATAIVVPLIAAVTAAVELIRGDVTAARRLLEDVPETGRGSGSLLAVRWHEMSARVHIAAGDPEAALTDIKTLGDWVSAYGAKHGGWVNPDVLAAEARLALGDTDRAAVHAAEALMAARAFRGPVQEGVALRAAALTADGPGVRLARLDEAVERFDAAGAELWAAAARVEQGAALAAAGEPAEAPLRLALEWADEAGAPAIRAAAASALLAAGHEPGAPSRRATHALTPAERRVVEFAASGLDPREIAQRLMITPATVRRRLASAEAKLDG